MKINGLILIAITSIFLLLSPAVSFAAGDQAGSDHSTMDMSGHDMDMTGHSMDKSNHDMDMPGHSMDMTNHDMNTPGHSMDMPDNDSMMDGGHDGMDHSGSTGGAPVGHESHGSSSHSGHNSGQGSGSNININGSTVVGGFGLVNGLIILAAALLKRKSVMGGGN